MKLNIKDPIFKHTLIYLLTIIGFIFLLFMWLRFYTNHNQKIEMVSLIGKTLKQANDLTSDNSFKLVVIDSIFVIGKPGGIILDQNPKPKSEVKEHRKVYVVITKYNADEIVIGDLPVLYGNDFVQKSQELKLRGVESKIRSKKYDPAEPNHILEVYYNNELVINDHLIRKDVKIKKGSFLEFVVSTQNEGEIDLPDLVCKKYMEAEFLLSESNLKIGELILKGKITDTLNAYIIDQMPKYDGISKIAIGSGVALTITQLKPAKCN